LETSQYLEQYEEEEEEEEEEEFDVGVHSISSRISNQGLPCLQERLLLEFSRG
jgi:hypothetical protein